MSEHLWLWVILAGLANYKASHMVSQDGDDGPFDLFKIMRNKVGKVTWFGRGYHCFSCVSFWGALIATLLIWPGVPVNQFLIIWAAVASISFGFWRYFG
jgi:hypothetical protein